MFGVLTNQGDQYYEGTYYRKKTDVEGKYFRYEWLESQRRSYGQIINNLIAIQGRSVIKTNWDLDWIVKGFIVTKDGKRWTIVDITKMEQEVNPQTRYWLTHNADTDYVISLVEVDNEKGLK